MRRWSTELGLACMGVTAPFVPYATRARLRSFVERGRHMDMDWFAAKLERRCFPDALLPSARAILVVGLSYAPSHPTMTQLAQLNRVDRVTVSQYARCPDYHQQLQRQLRALGQRMVAQWPETEIRVFVDTAPIAEKPLAARAGLGWQGKHTNLVSRRDGSWLVLGSIFTSLALPQDAPHPDHCGSCTRCSAICPTGALDVPYQLDTQRCLAYWLVEAQGPIPLPLRRAVGNRLFGCDDCLAVCPWNRFAQHHRAQLQERPDLVSLSLINVLRLTDAQFRRQFAGTALRRLGWRRLQRNALINAGNALAAVPEQPDLLAAIHSLSAGQHADSLLQEAAQWALAQAHGGTV